MGVDKFYKNSAILTLSNFVTGFIGFAFSIVLSKKLGPEGLGLYGLVMPIYCLMVCLTSDGLITAISKRCAVYNSKKDYRNLHRTVKVAFIFIFLWSVFVAFLVFINASNISSLIIKDSRATDALKIICPALVFIPMSAIVKGVFYGFEKFTVPAAIDILEKCIRISILMATIVILNLTDVTSSVSAAYFALCIGEAISLVMLASSYRFSIKRVKPIKTAVKNPLQLLADILVISFPLCINGVLSSILNTASTLILPRRLVSAGFDYENALALIGKFVGMALTTVYLPFIIVGSMMTVLIPDMSLSLSKKDAYSTQHRISQVLRISFLVGLGTLAIATGLSKQLGLLFYGRIDLSPMIMFAGISCFLSYVTSTSFGILNGLGKQNVNLRNSTIVAVEGLILVYILTAIPELNIYGYGLSLIITSITAFILNVMEIRKTSEVHFYLTRISVYCIFGVTAFMVCRLSLILIPTNLLVFQVVIPTILTFAILFGFTKLYLSATK